MRFQVPQFIEHEPKVIGPLTFRQFIYVGVPSAIAFFLYFLSPFYVFLPSAIVLGAVGIALAFIQMGGRSLPALFMGIFRFTITPKRYMWQKGQAPIEMPQQTSPQQSIQQSAPQKRELQLTQKSKIKDLSTRVETNK